MERMIIEKSPALTGNIRVMGAKNAALPILAATLLGTEEIILDDVPSLKDVEVMIEVLESLGAEVEYLAESTVRINAANIDKTEPPYELMRMMRASFLVLGPILARLGTSRTSTPGGCAIGARPIDLHLKGFRALGAVVTENNEEFYVEASAPGGLVGNSMYLDFPSVGATQNIIMAASLSRGETVIENAAKEPEIVDLCQFLNKMGADIKGAGTSNIKIRGVEKLHGARHSIIPDRIETATFMIAAAMTKGDLLIENTIPDHVHPISAKLKEMGCFVEEDEEIIRVKGPEKLIPTSIKTLPYPGFPTDAQAQFMAMLTICPGKESRVVETVFENRFMHAEELVRMGANIKTEGNVAIVKGVKNLYGAEVRATDLRAGAALILAGLVAEGQTVMGDLHHIDRGYVDFEGRLRSIGANITRVAM